MKKNILGAVIKDARKKKKLTQKDLSRLTGYSQNTISNHENGNRSLDEDNIKTYAAALGLTSDDLFDALDIQTSIEPNIVAFDKKPNKLNNLLAIFEQLEEPRQAKVYHFAEHQLKEQSTNKHNNIVHLPNSSVKKYDFPWKGFVSAGTGEYLDGEMDETISLTEDEIPSNADFALTVNGDSMKPIFKDHETIFVEETTELPNGSIGIVIVNDEAYVKKIYYSMFSMTLVSLNDEYEDVILNREDNVKIIGRVII